MRDRACNEGSCDQAPLWGTGDSGLAIGRRNSHPIPYPLSYAFSSQPRCSA